MLTASGPPGVVNNFLIPSVRARHVRDFNVVLHEPFANTVGGASAEQHAWAHTARTLLMEG